MPILYRYDKNTKEYIGSIPACEDPMASKRTGKTVYVILDNATLKEPVFEEGKIPVFNTIKEDWDLLEDNRGKVVYKKNTGERLIIQELGSIPKGYTEEKPITLQDLKFEKINLIKTIFNEEISKEVEIKGLKVTVSSRGELYKKLENVGDADLIHIENKETSESEFYKKEDIEFTYKYLYLREMLLACRKNLLIKEINSCISKKALDSVKLSLDVDKMARIHATGEMEEIQDFIKSLIGENK